MDLKYLLNEAKYYKKVDGGIRRIGTKFLLVKTPLKKLVNSRIYNTFYSRRIKKSAKKIRPYILSIENTNKCNAKCIMCPHTKMKRKMLTMSQKNFEKIINKVMEKEKIRFVTITGFGEPLIDREIDKKIKFLNKNYPLVKVIIFTNASVLTKEMSDKLLKLDVFKINFSINGTESNYKRIMGLDYLNTSKNINYFLEKKKESKKEFPLINVSLMILDDNSDDIKAFVAHWQKRVDSVMTYLPSDWAGGIDHGIVKNPFRNKRWPCMALWKYLTIDVNGNVIVCCRDYESCSKIGNILKNKYEDVMERLETLKKRQLDGDYDYSICKNCDNSFDSSLDWWE